MGMIQSTDRMMNTYRGDLLTFDQLHPSYSVETAAAALLCLRYPADRPNPEHTDLLEIE